MCKTWSCRQSDTYSSMKPSSSMSSFVMSPCSCSPLFLIQSRISLTRCLFRKLSSSRYALRTELRCVVSANREASSHYKKRDKKGCQSKREVNTHTKKHFRHSEKFIGIVLFSNIIVVITTLADIAFYTTSSHNTNTLYLLFSCVTVFGMSMATIILLYFTLRPSLAWTKVMKMLKRPNILHVLSSKYFGIGDTSQGLTLFFEGMEAQRERVVWQCFGVPITVEVYRRAIVSLISIVTLAVGLVVRDIMIKSSNL